MTPGTPASAHRVIGVLAGQHAQMVPDDLIAWHAQEDNQDWLSIEFAQAFPDDVYSPWQIQTGIAVCVEWCRKYSIVPSYQTLRRHQDTEQGQRGGKSDPGNAFPYIHFVTSVQAAL